MLDFLIKNATVIDGTGRPGYPADVGIQGEQIVAIQDLSQAEAGETISAQGMVVAPGFIDMHSHADYTLPVSPTANSKVHQGVTFELVGNCGISPAPIDDNSRQTAIANTVLDGPGLDWEWDYIQQLPGSPEQHRHLSQYRCSGRARGYSLPYHGRG